MELLIKRIEEETTKLSEMLKEYKDDLFPCYEDNVIEQMVVVE